MSTFAITTGYVPGCIGRVTELHGVYYARRRDWGAFFEGQVAGEVAEFFNRDDPARDGFWAAWDGETLVGALAIDGREAAGEGARLRWFIVAEGYQGRGLGKRLMDAAMDFCRAQGFRRVYLTTIASLEAARHLYERAGFRLCEEEESSRWGKPEIAQKYELLLR